MSAQDDEVVLLRVGETAWRCPCCHDVLKNQELPGIVRDSARHMMENHRDDPRTIQAVANAIDDIVPLGQSRAQWAMALMGDGAALQELASAVG